MPPQPLCNLYKTYQKMDDVSVDSDLNVVDFRRGLTIEQKEKIVPVDSVTSEVITAAHVKFVESSQSTNGKPRNLSTSPDPCTVYEHKDFDG